MKSVIESYFENELLFRIFIGIFIGLMVVMLVAAPKTFKKFVLKMFIIFRNRKILVFVSTGGTCRDPMAKIILEQLLIEKKNKIKVYAVGVGAVTSLGASKAAQFVIKEIYGVNLLKDFKTANLTSELAKKADLILCMEENHVKMVFKLHPHALGKTKLLREFFGLTGDVDDPWKEDHEMDAETIERYRICAKELRKILTDNIDHLVDTLSV